MLRSKSRVEDAVGHVSLWRGRAARVSPLSGGLTNENYLVETGGERYVMRIPGASTELLSIDRGNEVYNTKAAASTGIGPRVLEHIPDLDVMVLEFIEGETMSAPALQSAAMVRRMAESFKRLHAGPRFKRAFDMFRLIETYLRIVEEHEVEIPADYRERLPLVAEIERAVRVGALPSVPCHNDLLAENYIDDGEQLWIIDFEYSGNNDPCFELGDTAQECAFDDELRVALCTAYFGGDDPVQLARMELFALMADVGWTLWAAIQAKISSIDYDFWGWAEERWARAVLVMDSREFAGLLQRAIGA